MIYFAIPGDLATISGGYGYDRRVIAELGQQGVAVSVVPLSAAFPWPTPTDLANTHATFMGLPIGATVLVDGLALGAMPTVAAAMASRLRLVALIHHPLAYETGLTAAQQAQLRASEMAALAYCERVVVTSHHTGELLRREYAVNQPLFVALPGVDLPELADELIPSLAPALADELAAPKQFLCVGAFIPRKGHARLIRAFDSLRELDWHLHCVGRLIAPTSDQVIAQIRALELTDRITLHGEQTDADLARHYAQADALVSAAHYEGFGMALAEALAYGVPVIATTGGAVADWLPAGAAQVVTDEAALAAVLGRFMTDPAWATHQRQQARQSRASLPTWSQTATVLRDALTFR